MKIYILTIGFLLISLFSLKSQTLRNPTIGLSGGTINYSTYKGGFTVGEVGVKNYIGSIKYLEGFQFLDKDDPYPTCLTVTSVLPDGEGTFRAAVACALPGDEIVFDPSLSNNFLFFDLPAIVIDKPISINNTYGIIKFRNINTSNSQALILFSNNITIENGIELNGGMIINIVAPYTLTWK